MLGTEKFKDDYLNRALKMEDLKSIYACKGSKIQDAAMALGLPIRLRGTGLPDGVQISLDSQEFREDYLGKDLTMHQLRMKYRCRGSKIKAAARKFGVKMRDMRVARATYPVKTRGNSDPESLALLKLRYKRYDRKFKQAMERAGYRPISST
jgi:hypothetical protein